MHVGRVNLLLTGILLLITLFVIAVVYKKWRRAMKTVKMVRRKLYHIIPHMEHPEYQNLHFSSLRGLRATPSLGFDVALGKVLISSIMSTYNLYGGFEPHLPSYVTLVKRIGANGALYRLYKNLHILSFRGTMTSRDLISDLDFSQTLFRPSKGKALVHRGFYSLWESHKAEVEREIKGLDGEASLYITGHSLGAAVASFAAFYLSGIMKKITLYVFASPRIGNDVFMEEFSTAVPHHWAHLNARDLVCDLPPSNCPTFTTTYLYDDYRNIYRSDYQTGEIVGNHHLETYARCLGHGEVGKPLWNRPSIVIQT